MTSQPVIGDLSQRSAAKLAGLGYVALFVLGVFANFFVLEGLTEAGDAAATLNNIASSEGLFRAGLVAFLTIFLLDVFIAWLLYLVFRPINRTLSLLTAWLRLMYTVFLGVALASLIEVLHNVEIGDSDAVLLGLKAFESTWLIGLAVFGLHLGFLGLMMIESTYMPRLIGWVLIVSGLAYVFDTTAHLIVSDYEKYSDVFLVIVAIPSIVGELAFTVWLLARAAREQGAS